MPNPGKDAPIPRCSGRCGNKMNSFDQLPRSLRDFFNYEVTIKWCTCTARDICRARGEAATLAHYRELERRYR
jgi:hypothetical protein